MQAVQQLESQGYDPEVIFMTSDMHTNYVQSCNKIYIRHPPSIVNILFHQHSSMDLNCEFHENS